jgi:hypothetical protein
MSTDIDGENAFTPGHEAFVVGGRRHRPGGEHEAPPTAQTEPTEEAP